MKQRNLAIWIAGLLAVFFLSVLPGCSRTDRALAPRDPDLVIKLRWIKSYPGQSRAKTNTGLFWALSFLGARLPADATILSWDGTMVTVDLDAAGVPQASRAAWKKLLQVLKSSEEYRVMGGIDMGRFVFLSLCSSRQYYALTGFQPLTALRIVTVMNVLWLICSILLVRRIFGWQVLDSALFILLSGWALRSGLRLGHPYILISTLCLLGYYLYLKRMPWLAGLAVGILAPIKYYPVIVLVGFAAHRQWRVLLGGGIAIAAVVLVSIGVLGWQVHQVFLLDVLFNHLAGHIDPGPAFTAVFQSFDTLFNRLFIFDPTQNPHPLVAAPLAATVAIVGTKSLLVLVGAVTVTKLARSAAASAIAPTIGILGVLAFLIAPGSGTYAFVLLWLPVALLIDYFLSQRARVPAYLILAAYVLIGLLPHIPTLRFEGRGGLTVLAYPRLFLLLAMFVVCVYAVLRTRPLEQQAAPLVA